MRKSLRVAIKYLRSLDFLEAERAGLPCVGPRDRDPLVVNGLDQHPLEVAQGVGAKEHLVVGCWDIAQANQSQYHR